MTLAAEMWINDGFHNGHLGDNPRRIQLGESIPVLEPPWRGEVSSLKVYEGWVTFWESENFDEGDDQLWFAPPPAGLYWKLENLHLIARPHGNNHWGDRIQGVSFSGPPSGSNENRTIFEARANNLQMTIANAQLSDDAIRERLRAYEELLRGASAAVKLEPRK